jgi:hypothetical protein
MYRWARRQMCQRKYKIFKIKQDGSNKKFGKEKVQYVNYVQSK